MSAVFRLAIITAERVFYDGDAEMLVLPSPDGEIGIMAGHEPMVISSIEGEIHIRKDGQNRWAAASAGFATVTRDEVLLMLQTAEWPEEIDVNRAEHEKEEAEEIMRQKQSMQEYAMTRSMLARAMVRLRLTKDSSDTK